MAKVFSTEDGNLGSSVRVVKQRLYSDFDLSFAARTTTDGDLYKKTDAAAVKQAIKTLLLTNKLEKPYRPQFGGNLGGLLFSLADEDTGAEIADRVKKSIARYEPRAEIVALKVSATPDYNTVSVRLEFRVVDTNIVDVIDLKLTDTVNESVAPNPVVTAGVSDPLLNVNGAVYSSFDTVLTTGDGEVLVRS